MAWEAGSGWKRTPNRMLVSPASRLNGLGSPFGFETCARLGNAAGHLAGGMAWEARSGLKRQSQEGVSQFEHRLNGLGSPFGFETAIAAVCRPNAPGLNGLGSPFGFETPVWSVGRQHCVEG